MSLYQPVAQRESQAGAFAGRLGGEERGEEIGRQVPGDARAGVPDPKLRVPLSPGGGEGDAPGLARLQSAHRLHRVGDQVEQHLLELVPISQDHDRIGA